MRAKKTTLSERVAAVRARIKAADKTFRPGKKD